MTEPRKKWLETLLDWAIGVGVCAVVVGAFSVWRAVSIAAALTALVCLAILTITLVTDH